MSRSSQNPHARSLTDRLSTAVGIFLLAILVALLCRVPRLGLRPMHTDEAVQAQLVLGDMLAGKPYRYNPHDGHGPVLVFTTRTLAVLRGFDSVAELSERFVRFTPVLYSLALLLVLPLMGDGLGRLGTAAAALFTAISPMMVYFSRYYIMEVPLVFFTTLGIACGWRFSVSRRPAWLYGVGLAVGLMYATKETCAIQFIAAGLAVAGTAVLEYFTAGAGINLVDRRKSLRVGPLIPNVIGAVALAALVAFLLLSDFFRDPAQPWDTFSAYANYAARSGTSGHEKPWWYYFGLMIGRREPDGFLSGELFLVLLAGVGMIKALVIPPGRYENRRLQRFFALYAPALFLGYSMISYKTPWSILGAQHAILILAAIGAAALLNAPFTRLVRIPVQGLLAIGTMHLGIQVWRQNFIAPADASANPYVYAHTSPDVLRLVDLVRQSSVALPQPERLRIMILHPEFGWPLPWYLRRFKDVGATDQMAGESTDLAAADVIIMPADSAALVGALMNATHRPTKGVFELRPGVEIGAIFRKGLLPEPPAPRQAQSDAQKAAPPPQPAPPAAVPDTNPATPPGAAPEPALPAPPANGQPPNAAANPPGNVPPPQSDSQPRSDGAGAAPPP